MEGVIYLLNQSGIALSEANQRINALSQEVEYLRAEIESSKNDKKKDDK